MTLSDEQLEKYLAGTLSPEEMEEVNQALEADAPMKEGLSFENALVQDPQLSIRQASPEFATSIMQRVLQGKFRFRDLVQTNTLGFLSGSVGLVLGAVLTLIVLVFIGTTLTIPGYLDEPLLSPSVGLETMPEHATPIMLGLAAIALLYLLDRVLLRRLFSREK